MRGLRICAMLDREGDDCQPGDVALLGDEALLRRSLARLRDAGVTEFCAVLYPAEEGSRERTQEFLRGEIESDSTGSRLLTIGQ